MKARIPELDGIRGLAVLLVLTSHYASNVLPGFAFDSVGAAAVTLFFVLSGFLIGGIILDERESPLFFRSFYLRRTARILPIYVVVIALTSLGYEFIKQFPWGQTSRPLPAWVYLTFTNNIAAAVGIPGGPMLAPAWSLAVEEQFYLVAPLLLAWAPNRLIPALLLALCASALAFRIVNSSNAVAIEVLLPSRMDSLAMGIAAAYAHRTLSFAGRSTLLLSLSLISLAAMAITGRLQAGYADLYGLSLLPAAAALILLAAINGSRIAPFLRSAWLRFFGEISYGLYLVHQPILVVLCGAILNISIFQPSIARVPVAIAGASLSVALAALSWRFFEKPIIDFARQRAMLVGRSA